METSHFLVIIECPVDLVLFWMSPVVENESTAYSNNIIDFLWRSMFVYLNSLRIIIFQVPYNNLSEHVNGLMPSVSCSAVKLNIFDAAFFVLVYWRIDHQSIMRHF